MKVLIATKEGQGKRPNDFFWASEGELVTFPSIECDREAVDGHCGCRRSMAGMTSLKATTTFKVVELPMTGDDLKSALRQELEDGGWLKLMGPDKSTKLIDSTAARLCRVASSLPVGVPLERRGRVIRLR